LRRHEERFLRSRQLDRCERAGGVHFLRLEVFGCGSRRVRVLSIAAELGGEAIALGFLVREGGGGGEECVGFLRHGAGGFVAGVVHVGVHFDFVRGFVDADGAAGGGAGEGPGAGELSELGEEGRGVGVVVGVGVSVSRGFSAAEEEEDSDCADEEEESEGDTDGDADFGGVGG